MIRKRRTTRLAVSLAAVAAAATGALTFTGAASAATFNANSTATLASAISSAETAGGTNTIVLAAGSYTPAATATIPSGNNITIDGPAAVANVNGGQAKIVGGAIVPTGAPVFSVSSGATLSLQDVAFSNAGSGGNPVVDDFGTVTMNQVGIGGASGPGFDVESGATGTVTNSTIADGLDIGIIDDGTLSLIDDTVTGNANGGVDNANGTLNLTNTIIADNSTSADCTGAATTSDHSLDSDSTCGVGTLSGKNPKLGSIGSHGGDTPTLIPASGSPAIGAGDCSATLPTVDQRGATRPSTACDIGAVQTDTVAPVFTTANVTQGTTNNTAVTVNYTPTWTDAGSPVTSTCTPASGSTFSAGTTTVTCSGTDVFGNTGSGTFTVDVVNNSGPSVTTSGNVTAVATSASGATATFTASATDPVDGTDPVTCTPASGSVFPIGTTTVTCKATDSAGLTGTATLTVTVTDPPPVVSQPQNITVVATAPQAVTYTTPTATDFADGTDPVTCMPASGTTFALGTTTVTCSATNAAGEKTSVTFTVDLVAQAPPQTDENIKGETPSVLSITATAVDFGPVFIPGVAATYPATGTATVTSTDSSAVLTINDISTASTAGHLLNGTFALANPFQVQATSASPAAVLNGGGNPFISVTGSPQQILAYSGPVTNDAVTLNYQQTISASEALHNGTYQATVLLALTGTP